MKKKKRKKKKKEIKVRIPEEFYFCSKRNRVFKNKKKVKLLKREKITEEYDG